MAPGVSDDHATSDIVRPDRLRSRNQYAVPIISKTAGDTRSVITSRDPKGQGHPDIFLDRNIISKSVRDGIGLTPCSLNIILFSSQLLTSPTQMHKIIYTILVKCCIAQFRIKLNLRT